MLLEFQTCLKQTPRYRYRSCCHGQYGNSTLVLVAFVKVRSHHSITCFKSFIMHGRKRDEYKALHRDPKMIQKLSAKATAWHQLQHELLHRQTQWKRRTVQEPAESATAIQEDVTIDATRKKDFILTTLSLLEKAVTVNADPIWLWNFRRSIVAEQLKDPMVLSVDDARTVLLQTLFDKEHALTQLSLQNNPKAYAVWHYRKWCIQQQLLRVQKLENALNADEKSESASSLLNHELQLCTLFLQRDERNFHCWSYRRFIVSCCLWSIRPSQEGVDGRSPFPTGEWYLPNVLTGLSTSQSTVMGTQIAGVGSGDSVPPQLDSAGIEESSIDPKCRDILQGEWEFTTTKIHDNFSNFSAFHYRGKLLPLMIRLQQHDVATSKNDVTLQMIQKEFELITNAIFTEPDDQTAWWYQEFLLQFIQAECSGSPDQPANDRALLYHEHIVRPHLEQLRELQQETNSTSKWVLIGVLQCLQWISGDASDDISEQEKEILLRLIQMDSDRKERYEHLLRKI
jgi:geranylgeranyl transferase type-2 subunit alpha